jgi:hypothetical protein
LRLAIVFWGKVKRVEHVDRGGLMCYTRSEWEVRASREQSRGFRFYIALLLFLVAWTVLRTWRMATFGELGIDIVITIFYIVTMATLVTFAIRFVMMNRNPPAVPALYEYGVQLPWHVFVPYTEIGRIERDRASDHMLRRHDLIRLRSRFTDKPFHPTDGWEVSADFLGPRGLATLVERMEIARGMRSFRPALTVYGPGGARTSGPGTIHGR